MIDLSKGRPGKFSALTVSLTMLTLLYPAVPPGSGGAWAQERRTPPVPFAVSGTTPTRVAPEMRAVQRKPDPSGVALPAREPTRVAQETRAVRRKSEPSAVALQERRAIQRKPDSSAVSLPETQHTGGALGTALASCEKESESSETLALPGARGEVKLDRCYRGRDHFVCSFNALLGEARTLIEEYGRIVEAHYPNVSNVAAVCDIKPDALSSDLRNATDFMSRFKALKAEYDARSNCATRVGQSLKDVTLPDMAQAPEILRSMIDSLEGDLKSVSVVQAKVVELAETVNSSQKAIITIQKIHRIMCVKGERALSQIERSAIR
jgi:hypothetical protein